MVLIRIERRRSGKNAKKTQPTNRVLAAADKLATDKMCLFMRFRLDQDFHFGRLTMAASERRIHPSFLRLLLLRLFSLRPARWRLPLLQLLLLLLVPLLQLLSLLLVFLFNLLLPGIIRLLLRHALMFLLLPLL